MSVEAFEPSRPSCREGDNQDLSCARRTIGGHGAQKRRGTLGLCFQDYQLLFFDTPRAKQLEAR
jgi:hypothetical protein